MDAAQVDDQDAVDEDEHVVGARELQREVAAKGEEIAGLVVNQKSWNQPCCPMYHLPPQFIPVGQPVAVSGGIRLGGKRYWSPLQLLPAPKLVELYQYGQMLHCIASVPTISGAVPGPTGATW